MVLKKSVMVGLILTVVVVMLLMAGCSTMTHTVGKGKQTGIKEEASQWYLFWGLMPVSVQDSQVIAKGASDYKVTTKMTFVDGLISWVIGWIVPIGIQKWTVTIEK